MVNIDVENKLNLTVNDLIKGSIAVLGSSGSGKSNTIAVMAEELLSAGVSMTIVDPAGDYYTLRERHDVIIAGESDHVDVAVSPDQAGLLAGHVYDTRSAVVLDLLLMDEAQRIEFVQAYIDALWARAIRTRQPHVVILDEAQTWIPQTGPAPLRRLFIKLAGEGRKFGISLIAGTQRMAKIDKNVLTQAALLLAHQAYFASDLKVYADLLPGLKPAQVEEQTRSLKPGEAFFVRGPELTRVKVRQRHTTHPGATPTLEQQAAPVQLRQAPGDALAALRQALAAATPTSAPVLDADRLAAEVVRLEAECVKLRELVALKEQHIKRLESQLVLHAPVRDAQLSLGLQLAPGKARPGAADAAQRQAKQLNKRLRKLQALAGWERQALAFLLENPGKGYDAGQLARELGYAESTIKGHMKTLVSTGMVIEQPGDKRDGKRYAGVETIHADYPALRPEAVMALVLEAVR